MPSKRRPISRERSRARSSSVTSKASLMRHPNPGARRRGSQPNCPVDMGDPLCGWEREHSRKEHGLAGGRPSRRPLA
jgi:hypothetical protein